MLSACRSLAKSPGYALAALLTLALGIGSAVAIFSVLHAVLLSPLSYREPERLAWLRSRHPEQGSTGVASATFADLLPTNRAFSHLAMRTWSEAVLTHAQAPLQVDLVQATTNYFETLGVPPLLGRTWTVAEAQPGASAVVVLGNRFFARHFGSDPAILGQSIRINDVPHLVLGVMPESFRDPLNPASDTLAFVPMPMTEARARDRGGRYWGAIGRLKPEASFATANAELATFARGLERDYGDLYRNWTLEAIDLRDRIVQGARGGILLASGGVACLLLIAGVNVAGLALVRALARRRELAIRTALGASRRTLIRQLLGESLVLAAAAGVAGTLLGQIGLRALVASLPAGWLPRSEEISLNPVVLGFALLLTLVLALATGLAPALAASRADAQDALTDGSRGSRGRESRRIQAGLVVAEIALAMLLLAGAGVLGRSLLGVLQRDAGMQTDQVLSATLSVTAKRYNTMEKRLVFLERVQEEVAAVPGVTSVGFTQTPPFRSGWTRSPFLALGPSLTGADSAVTCYSDSVSPEYFRTVGVPLLAGRNFERTDRMDTQRVIIVSQATARKFFGDANPLGRALSRPGGGDTAQIVGVVADTRRDGLTAEAPLQVYRPIGQHASTIATLMVRSDQPASSLVRAVEAAVQRVDPDMPLSDVGPLSEFVRQTVTAPQLHLRLFAWCGAIALFLSAIGLHSVVAYSVGQRRREFGIRSALGATPRAVLRQVLGESSRLIGFGLLAGLAAALASGQLLASLVYDVSPQDPVVLTGIAALLALVTFCACLLPARRAMRADPIAALRAE